MNANGAARFNGNFGSKADIGRARRLGAWGHDAPARLCTLASNARSAAAPICQPLVRDSRGSGRLRSGSEARGQRLGSSVTKAQTRRPFTISNKH